MSDVFEGDVLLSTNNDGADIEVENALIKNCVDFDTAILLSLFGGNKDDDCKVRNNKTWWGNYIGSVSESEKVQSRFQNIIEAMPLSLKNAREAEKAAVLDLAWLKAEGFADSVFAEGKVFNRNNFILKIIIKKDVEILYEKDFPVLWKGVNNGL